MRLAVTTLCFAEPAFSGNCFAARSYVAALAAHGHECMVVCAYAGDALVAPPLADGVRVHGIRVTSWFRVDIDSPWREFGEGAQADATLAQAMSTFAPHVLIFIDWTSRAVAETCKRAAPAARMLFMPFRVYHTDPDLADHVRARYAAEEGACVALARAVIALGSLDAARLAAMSDFNAGSLLTLNPPLRDSLAAAAAAAAEAEATSPAASPARCLVLCAVRVLPAKNVELFVSLIERLAPLLERRGLVPCLCGAAPDAAFAERVYSRLLAACPRARVLREAVDSSRLGALFRETALNVHTSLYEPWGLTIAEAAAFGAPSLCHERDIGVACDLLAGAVCAVDMTNLDAVAAAAAAALDDEAGLRRVAAAARTAALAWGEREAGAALDAILVRLCSE